MAQGRLYRADMSPNQIQEDAEHARVMASQGGDSDPKIDDYWLLIARDAYNEAESYYDANIRHNHERNMSHFQSRHAPGSKYYTDAYRFRHKGFRPKTRSMVRRQEAALVKAMFSTADFVTVKAARSNHPAHRISAEINQALLQYRLENTIPWFQTAIGAYQETLNLGLCISHQYWNYQEDVDFEESASEDIGPPVDEQQETIPNEKSTAENLKSEQGQRETLNETMETPAGGEVIYDTPAVELRPAENLFFSVAADWRDPANTSPFIIDKIPMFLDDVKAMASPRAGTEQTAWFPLTEAQLLTGVTTDYDPVRRQREENREDSKEQRHLHRGFDTVWVHRNIVRKDGVDWIYYTLGVHYRLSEPVPLREDPQYKWLKPGERPYIIGFSNLEAHKNYPDSLVGISARTQQDANQLNNSRFDNVELSLNRRYITKRSAMIDYRGLQRNVPGGVTETDDPDKDIRIEQPPDVTSSSYEEQNRINSDYDELVGMFSGSSVANNRQMNETVGGMKLMAGDADALTDYPLMVFTVTWAIPVLKQLVRLEQTYESDAALLNLIGERLDLWQRYEIDAPRLSDKWIQGAMNIQVAVGAGSSNPDQQINRLATGMGIILQMAPGMMQQFDGVEFAKEILGSLGYRGTERFFPQQGPQQGAAMPQQDEGALTEQDQAKLDQDYRMHEEKMAEGERRLQWEIEKHFGDMEQKAQERLLKKEISQQQFEEKMERIATDRQNKVDEMKVKLRTGQGI